MHGPSRFATFVWTVVRAEVEGILGLWWNW
jgi:hypothetical protein